MTPNDLLDLRTRQGWRRWLEDHHDSSSAVWLVFHKRHTGVACIEYGDAVEEALCFGWIDSIVRRLDDARYARKFTPRRANSNWSTANRRRYADMKSRGLLAKPGLERAPTGRSGDAPMPSATVIPSYIVEGLQSEPGAWQFFKGLAPSYRRMYVAWIESAKRPETRARRLREATHHLAAGKKLGLK